MSRVSTQFALTCVKDGSGCFVETQVQRPWVGAGTREQVKPTGCPDRQEIGTRELNQGYLFGI